MNIVRWLTHHPILSVWALTIVALLLSLGGTGGKKHGEDDANVASNKHVEAEAPAHHAEGHGAENKSDDANHHAQAVVATAPVNATNNQVQTMVPVPAVPAPENNAVVNTDAVEAGTTKVATSEVAKTPVVEVASTDTSSAEEKPSTNDLSDKSVDDLLLMAREAYWNNGLDEAASIYQQLIQREPNVVEHKGELGNVYWRQGFPEKSASLYADIAIPMIDKGNAARVSNMIGFIGLFHPDKAAKINQHMQSTAK